MTSFLVFGMLVMGLERFSTHIRRMSVEDGKEMVVNLGPF